MTEHDAVSNKLNPVSPETLKIVDAVTASIEEDVLRGCLSADNPERQMGPEAKALIKNGLGFVSKMLHAMMAFGAGNIVEDQLEWARIHLPVYGISMTMVLNNLERYAVALEKKLPPIVYGEIQPYLESLIHRQRTILGETNGNNAG